MLVKEFNILNKRNKKLSSQLYSADSTLSQLVIISHGFNEDKTLQGMTPIYAESLVSAGISVLAYDFSGFGKSDAEFVSNLTSVEDLRSVIEFAIDELSYNELGLFGHSFGSLVSLECYSEKITAIATIGTLMGALPFSLDKIFMPEHFEEFSHKGYASELRTYGTRPEILVDKKIIDEITLIDQKNLLSRIKCPVLIIHGDAESEECALHELSKKGMAYLSKDSEIHCLHGADHNFRGFNENVVKLITDWFKKYLLKSS